jgi:hypothetical protein
VWCGLEDINLHAVVFALFEHNQLTGEAVKRIIEEADVRTESRLKLRIEHSTAQE